MARLISVQRTISHAQKGRLLQLLININMKTYPFPSVPQLLISTLLTYTELSHRISTSSHETMYGFAMSSNTAGFDAIRNQPLCTSIKMENKIAEGMEDIQFSDFGNIALSPSWDNYRYGKYHVLAEKILRGCGHFRCRSYLS